MENIYYIGEARTYNYTTGETTIRRWRKNFTQEQVMTWMEEREKFMRDIYEVDIVDSALWDSDHCYRMMVIRKAKKSRAGRQLKPMAVCYIFTPFHK